MTKAQQSERDEFISKLRATLKPGDTLHMVLRHVSRSGMSRVIDVYHFHTLPDGRIAKDWLSDWIAKACEFQFSKGGCGRPGPEGIKIGGGGQDMGFAIVYDVGRTLWPDGSLCIGDKCQSNDHRNARSTNCAVCGAKLRKRKPGEAHYTKRGHDVCSQSCASGEWLHSDSGYSLNHEWL